MAEKLPIDGDELERLALARSLAFQALLNKSRRQIQEEGGIPHERFWLEVDADAGKARFAKAPDPPPTPNNLTRTSTLRSFRCMPLLER
jgi:hypothetical protein